MKVVETMLVRDEADVVGAHIAFSLNAGVDFVLVMDHDSQDGTTEVLESYVRSGVLRRLPVTGRYREQEWRTALARMAASEHGADWILNSDADQFWWPRTGTLHDALALLPASVGVVRSWDRVFVPTPDDGRHFAERMVFRFVSRDPLNIPWSNYRPLPRLVHRADPRARVSRGSHRVWTELLQLDSWSPLEVFHFPWRSTAQMRRKAEAMWRAFVGESRRPGGYHDVAHRATSLGSADEHYASLALDRAAVERGIRQGALVEDVRLRDALRSIAGVAPLSSHGELFPPNEHAERVPLPHETPALRTEIELERVSADEAELVRLQRRLDELTRRVAALERRGLPRLQRAAGPA